MDFRVDEPTFDKGLFGICIVFLCFALIIDPIPFLVVGGLVSAVIVFSFLFGNIYRWVRNYFRPDPPF